MKYSSSISVCRDGPLQQLEATGNVHCIHAAGRVSRRAVAAAEANGYIRKGWREAPAGDRTGQGIRHHRKAVAGDASDCDKEKRSVEPKHEELGLKAKRSRTDTVVAGDKIAGEGGSLPGHPGMGGNKTSEREKI